MNKLVLVMLFFSLFLFGCEKDLGKINLNLHTKIVEKNNVLKENTKIYSGGNDTNNIELVNTKNKKIDLNNDIFSENKVYSGIKQEKYKYNWKMNKPNIGEMNNFEYITNGYHKEWNKTHTITENNIYMIDSCKDYLDTRKGGLIGFHDISTKKLIKEIPYKELKKGDQININSKYNGGGYFSRGPLNITGNELNFFQNHGWLLLDPKWNFVGYEGEGSLVINKHEFSEERYQYMRAIGGEKEEYDRYPYNTPYITSDLILHVFHVLFSNNLKYYEESNIRKEMSEISNSMYDKFLNLYKTEKDKELKKKYEFLTSYWSLASTFFVNEEKLFGGQSLDSWDFQDLTDNEIKSKLNDVLNSKINIFSEDTKKIILQEFESIMNAKEQVENPGHLISYFFPEILSMNMKLKQDYTQFKPRSHYTVDSLLKTYFIGMKFLMREKFYFMDPELAKTSMIQVNNLDDETMNQFDNIFEFITKLIGNDDDINIYDLHNFIKISGLKSDKDIDKIFDSNMHSSLLKLKKQNIISTSYETETIGEVTEQEAHEKTVGFLFFGEKTTIDSWIFDELSSGSAEEEYKTKPNVISSISVPHILGDNGIAGELINLWLNKNQKKYNITDSQKQGYIENSNKLIETVQYFNFEKNIYHKWLDTLNYLLIERGQNSPYFQLDKLYRYKDLITYMGSYSQLKHDTLLYIKQAYAELGGGGGDCYISIIPPSLPVPKGYVEPNIELIDKLIELSIDTNRFYNDEKIVDYIEFLKFVKEIALSQTNNETISNERFEKLRLYYIKLKEILVPQKYIGEPTQKETRGAIIADIFTSGEYGPLYEAIGRPQLLLVMIKDNNGSRIVIGPIFNHYSFYAESSPIESDSRLNDQDWQNNYDNIKDLDGIKSIEFEYLTDEIKKGN